MRSENSEGRVLWFIVVGQVSAHLHTNVTSCAKVEKETSPVPHALQAYVLLSCGFISHLIVNSLMYRSSLSLHFVLSLQSAICTCLRSTVCILY